MNIQIENLLLRRRNGVETFPYSFAKGKINLISGNNGRGKTSFIKAIDYALASQECAIDKHIRHAVDFVGVILNIDGERHLFARHVPYEKDDGLLCYHTVLNGTEDGFTTENFTKETGVGYKTMLPVINRLIGVDVAEEAPALGKTKHLSIRPLLDVVFQEYSAISDENNLFRNGGNTFSAGALKSWLPFVVGINTTVGMSARIERDDADARYKRLVHELTSAKTLSERWVAEIDAELQNCRALGLIGEDEKFPDGIDGQLLAFEKVRRRASQFYAASLSTKVFDESAVELSKLEEKQQNLSLELQGVQERIDLLKRCDRQVAETIGATRQFEDRLLLAEWLGEVWKDDRYAPLFATTLGKTGDDLHAELDKLSSALKDYQSTLTNKKNRTTYKIALRRELKALEDKRRKIEGDYSAVTEKINARAKEDRKLREHLDAQRLAYVQIGRIEKMVTLAHALIGRNPDDNELERLKVQFDAANDKVKAEEEAERERGIDFARAVNEILTAKVRELDATQDMQNANAEFHIEKLDIKLKYPDAEEWLSDRGSSHNHIAYHVAITSALEEVLADRVESPLPSFVFYDQPTQSKNKNPVVALERLFKSLEHSLEKSKEKNEKGWQPVVIDLVEKERLDGLDRDKYHLVTDLDATGGFVPLDWWLDER